MDASRFHTVKLGSNEVVLDTAIGHLRRLVIGGIAPLHTAPWVSDDPIDPASETPPTEQALSGDFFCAPFCMSDVEAAPLHGWTANAQWSLGRSDETSATYVLSRQVMGARVEKTLAFRDGHPFLYVTHGFDGGAGRVPISHHAMIRAATTVRLSVSPKALFFTPGGTPEPDPARGRSLLKYPAQGTDLGSVPLAAGGSADIRTYPFAEGHEDIIAFSETPGHALGWSAAVADDHIVLLLKDARVLPQTMLWMSNGGRYFPPWSSRHTRVLGIEDGCSFGPNGHRASIEPNMLSDGGVPTAIDLASNPRVHYAIGAIPRPAGCSEVSDATTTAAGLILRDVSEATIEVPFDSEWLLRK